MPEVNDINSLIPSGSVSVGDVKVETSQHKPESVLLEEQKLAFKKHEDTQLNLRILLAMYGIIILVSVILMILGAVKQIAVDPTFWEKVFWSAMTAGLGGLAGRAFAKPS